MLRKYLYSIAVLTVTLLSACLAAYSSEDNVAPRVAFIVDGRMGGEDLSPAEHRMAAKKLEQILTTKLQKLMGFKSFDQSALENLSKKKEQWAVLTGDTTGNVMDILKQYSLNAIVRCYFRTNPAFKTKDANGNTQFRASANVMLEIISFKTGEKGVLVWSPLMGSVDVEGKMHPLQPGDDEFESGMNALSYAAERIAEKLEGNAELKRLFSAAPEKTENAEPLKVIYLVQGRIKGKNINDKETRLGEMRMEATLADKLRKAFGIRSFDDAILAQVRKNAEEWKVLEGGSGEEVQKVLAKHSLDGFIRIYFRTAPAHKETDQEGNAYYSGTASVMAEIISFRTGEKGVLVESPPMGTADHPAKRAFDPFDAGVGALDYATDTMIQRLKNSPAVKKLGKENVPSEGADLSPADVKGITAIFVIKGKMNGDGILPVEQRVGAMHIESVLDRKLRQTLQLTNFDDQTLAKIRRNAEEWAVMLGENIDAIEKVLEKHNVDSVIRVQYRTDADIRNRDENGNTFYSATANMRTSIVSRKSGQKSHIMESPFMGNETHPAKVALDPFDAGVAALDYATEQMVAKLQADLGVKNMMKPAVKKEEEPDPDAGKPTVAVLWVRPTFSYWRIPRSRQPGLNLKKRKQMKAFVDYCKSTGKIGVKIADYLVSGLTASGALVPIENSKQAQKEMTGIRDKMAELRMAGWSEEKIPVSDPIQLSRKLKADYVVTAEISRIYETSARVSAPLLSKGNLKAEAEVTLTITNAKTGKSSTFKGEGNFKKSGFGTFVSFDPGMMDLDKMLIGGAIKEAVFNAARKVSLD